LNDNFKSNDHGNCNYTKPLTNPAFGAWHEPQHMPALPLSDALRYIV
jgi:hypothetical protein